MRPNLLFLFFVLSTSTVSGQFYKNFHLELSGGIMRCQNKEELVSDSYSFGLQSSSSDLKNESYILTGRRSVKLGFNISKYHAISIGYSRGKVGSVLNGTMTTVNDIGMRTNVVFHNSENIMKYSSIDLMYSLIIPFHEFEFITSIGVHKQDNSTVDLMLFRHGLIFDNYNTSLSVGLGIEVYKGIDIIPKITLINSHNNRNYIVAESLFVPFQVGVEIGLRLRFD